MDAHDGPHDGPAVIRALDAADWRRWKDVRLRALAEAPEAFCSTLAGTEERERAEGEAASERRMLRPAARSA